VDPYLDDLIRLEMNPRRDAHGIFIDPDEVEGGQNTQLDDVLNFYDAWDLLYYVNHIIWLSSVKEAVGIIPFKLDYLDICALVILEDEKHKKELADIRKTRNSSGMGMSAGFGKDIPDSAIQC
jgi:hypothetical protein